jgi:uncharacterized Tic20 family protein
MLYEDSFMSDDPIRQPDDQERVSRLSSTKDTDNETVREYERRYSGEDTESRPERRARQRELPRSYSTLRVTDDEKLWAAVAHGSAWITLLGGVLSVGAVVPLSIFIPLVIYFLFRQKSDFVAFHALQAFVLQLIGTVGALLLLLVGGLVWGIGMVIALLAVVILVGFILVPFWGLVGVVLLGVITIMPLAMIFFGTYAAIETYNGRDYRYPFIARWVDRQLAGSFLHTA